MMISILTKMTFYQQHLHRASHQQLERMALLKEFIKNGIMFTVAPPKPLPTKARRTSAH